MVSLARKIEEIISEFSPEFTTSWGNVFCLQNFSRKTPLIANSPTCTVCIKLVYLTMVKPALWQKDT